MIIVFLQGATTGGTDLIARLLKLKLRWLPMGKLLMAVDLAVILMVAAAFRTLNNGVQGGDQRPAPQELPAQKEQGDVEHDDADAAQIAPQRH